MTTAARHLKVQPVPSLLGISKRLLIRNLRLLRQPTHPLTTQRPDKLSLPTIRPPAHISLFHRRFMSSPPRRGSYEQPEPKSIGMEWYDLSPERQIKWLLGSGKTTKWGWVIYRCCYKPELDTSWDILKRLIREESREAITESDAPEIADQLDWRFVEDPALEGASRDELKPRFRNWARAEAGYDVDNPVGSRGSRYEYFIQVDEAALLSLLNRSDDPTNPGHVNMVRAWADPLPAEEATNQWGDEVDAEDWMKIQATMVAPYFYVEMDNDQTWYTFYWAPRHGVCKW